jgi:uncharacterized protein (DUF488 family)
MLIKTIGYGGLGGVNHLLTMLKEMNADVVIDVRLKPYCGWNKDFCANALKNTLPGAGIDYLWISDLGNLTKDVRNIKLANEARGIEKVLSLAGTYKYDVVVLLCAEAEEKRCHRLYVKNKLIDAIRPRWLAAPTIHLPVRRYQLTLATAYT